jgi:hypothetical protein
VADFNHLDCDPSRHADRAHARRHFEPVCL